jgi:hypothetical protein
MCWRMTDCFNDLHTCIIEHIVVTLREFSGVICQILVGVAIKDFALLRVIKSGNVLPLTSA